MRERAGEAVGVHDREPSGTSEQYRNRTEQIAVQTVIRRHEQRQPVASIVRTRRYDRAFAEGGQSDRLAEERVAQETARTLSRPTPDQAATRARSPTDRASGSDRNARYCRRRPGRWPQCCTQCSRVATAIPDRACRMCRYSARRRITGIAQAFHKGAQPICITLAMVEGDHRIFGRRRHWGGLAGGPVAGRCGGDPSRRNRGDDRTYSSVASLLSQCCSTDTSLPSISTPWLRDLDRRVRHGLHRGENRIRRVEPGVT